MSLLSGLVACVHPTPSGSPRPALLTLDGGPAVLERLAAPVDRAPSEAP